LYAVLVSPICIIILARLTVPDYNHPNNIS